jgi:hypothetical protein
MVSLIANLEKGFEVGWANCEHGSMGLDVLAVAREGYVHQIVVFQQLLEARTEVGVEVIPPERKLLSVVLHVCLKR